jgi:hypothetical protein
MYRAALAYAAVGIFAANSAFAACSKPEAPSCAIEGAFASAQEWDRCRLQMIAYKGGMEAFGECLREEKQDEQAAVEELEFTLSEFNRRSRELPDDGL